MKLGELKNLPHLPSQKNIYFHNENSITFANKLALEFSKENGIGHKGDNHNLKNPIKLYEIVQQVKNNKGDLFDKATLLLISLVQNHCFSSANRRTAYVVTFSFLKMNNEKMPISFFNPDNVNIMKGIREKFYSFNEIKEWIQTSKIKEFKR